MFPIKGGSFIATYEANGLYFQHNSNGALVMLVPGYKVREYNCETLMNAQQTPAEVRALILKAQEVLS